MKDINEIVRLNLYKARIDQELTQEGLAFKASLHRAYIGQKTPIPKKQDRIIW